MVKVPVDNSPGVRLNDLSGQRFQPFAMQSQDRRLGIAAKVLGNLSADQERRDMAKVEDQVNQARAAMLGLETDYTSQKGAGVLDKDGETFSQSYGKKFDETIATFESTFTNGKQREAFKRKVEPLRMAFRQGVSRHESRELEAYAVQTADSTIKLEREAAAKNYKDEDAVKLALGRTIAAVEAVGDHKGWGEDANRELARKDALAGFRASVLGGALDAKDTKFAKDYLDKYGDELDERTRKQAQTIIGKQEAANVVDNLSEDIWKRLGPRDDTDAVNLDAMMSEVRKVEDPDTRKLLESEIKDRAQTRDYSVRQREAAIESKLYQAIEKGMSTKQLRNNPDFMKLDGKKQKTILDQLEAERSGGSGTPENAGQEYWNLVENPDKLKAMNVEQIFAMTPRIGKGYREELLKKREKLLRPDEAAKVTIDQNLLKTEYRKALNLSPDRKLSERDNNLLAELEVKMQQIQQGSGVKWSMENSAKLAQELMRPVVTEKGWLKDKTQPLFKAMEQVPASYVQAVRAKAAAKGLNPSDEQIMRAYFADKEKGLVD